MFEPYTYEKHLELIDNCSATRDVNVSVIGQSLEGRDIELITVGKGPLKVWIQHRQHPGETQAEWFAQGLLDRLCGLSDFGAVDGLAHKAREAFTFYIIPNMNPDGSAHGYLRCNAGGQNLNREWCDSVTKSGEVYKAPTLERSPEVYHVLKLMDEIGVDAFADIHGDEEMPFNFIAGCEGCENWGPRMQGLQGAFLGAYCRANPDMQKEVSYDPGDPNGAIMNVASNQIGVRFDCLSITLEMPYKDCLTCSDPNRGYTGQRCARLGASIVDAFMHVREHLRSTEAFWERLGPDDQYVRPKEEWEGQLK
jgi:murein tripeptide amidase MpaA